MTVTKTSIVKINSIKNQVIVTAFPYKRNITFSFNGPQKYKRERERTHFSKHFFKEKRDIAYLTEFWLTGENSKTSTQQNCSKQIYTSSKMGYVNSDMI